MPRVLRIGGSLAIVLVVYWAYALVAVPLIEPPAEGRQGGEISQAQREAAKHRYDRQIAALQGLFPPGAWELGEQTKILESDQIKLLMQEYHNLNDGRVQIEPCTVIFTPDGPLDEAERKRRSVILEVPQGALLEFDKPFDLRQVKIGRLIRGKLTGPVTIRSQNRRPGNEDDLLLKTRDVELTEHHVWTRHPVDFQLGPHHGRGHQMHIKLIAGDETGTADRHGPNIAGVEYFEVRRVERLHLELGGLGAGADRQPGTAGNPGAASGSPLGKSDLPVELVCGGRFRFDVARKVATFEKQVNVFQIHPDGPSDQLNCEWLSIFFADRVETSEPARAASDSREQLAGSLDLEPQRLEARGNPVVLSAPGRHVDARGELLEYDLQTNRVVLDGSQEVVLHQGPNEIHARRIDYQSTGRGRLGQVLAEGPGSIRGQLSQRPDGQLQATWTRQLSVRPHEGNQVISLTGGAKLDFREFGQLDAPEIHLYLLESPPQEGSTEHELRPDRMLACQEDYLLVPEEDGRIVVQPKGPARVGADPTASRRDVEIRSSQLTATVEQLEIWFKQPAGGTTGHAPSEGAGPASLATLQPSAQEAPAEGDGLPAAESRHFQVTGRLLQATVLMQDEAAAELSELTVAEGVRFAETQTDQAGQQPLLVRGDRLHAIDAAAPHAAVTVTGSPAYFEGRGLSMTGPNIHLNRGTNRLWMDGAGRMDVPLDKDLDGRPLSHPTRLAVQWQDRMVFDGRTARFEDSVTAQTPNRHLRTETLEVQFRQPIDFSDVDAKRDSHPEVEQVLCRGGVFMESRTFEGQKQISHEKMQVADLTIHLANGAMTAGGPGWLTSVRPRPSGGLSIPGAVPTTAADTTTSGKPAEDDGLWCLVVHFRGSISGNLHQRQWTFRDQVRTAYAPVDSWTDVIEVDDPDRLGPKGVLLHADRLSVVEMTTPLDGRRSFELEAAGNTVAQGNTFTARAARITYDEAKGMLVLEGDGRSDAELFRQQQVGGPASKAAARKILYWPKTKRLKIDGARSFELSQFGTGGTGKR